LQQRALPPNSDLSYPDAQGVAVDVQAVDFHQEPASLWVPVAVDLIGRVGEPGYVRQLTQSLSHYVKFAHVCVLCFSRLKPPGLLGTGSTLSPACAEDTAYVYLDGHYNSDPTEKVRAASIGAGKQLYVQRQKVEDIVNAEYRTSCYEKPGIVDRLSLFQYVGPDTWIAVNVYRDSTQGYFDSSECERLVTVAPILTASADKHRQLVAKAVEFPTQVRNAPAPLTSHRRLASVHPILSNREYEVCSRILRGFSAKEIAQQLGVAPSTVAEHRKNAYAKLAVRGYKQLFAQFSS
jgi:DNA-binding CsgD family transcriptional regulator